MCSEVDGSFFYQTQHEKLYKLQHLNFLNFPYKFSVLEPIPGKFSKNSQVFPIFLNKFNQLLFSFLC